MGCAVNCVAFSLMLELVIRRQCGLHIIAYYLDCFLFMGLANTEQCWRHLDSFMAHEFGVPLAQGRWKAPLPA